MILAKQSTARTVIVGPILDSSGAAVTGAVVGDLKISKNGGAPAALNGSATLTHRHTGHYSLALTTSDLDTQGTAQVTLDRTTDAMPVKDINVLQADAYDQFVSGSYAKLGVAGTVGASATTTSIPTSSLSPAAAVTDQFKGRVLIFDDDTATTQLRGQATDITASTSGGTLTVTALTNTPASGDTFRIV